MFLKGLALVEPSLQVGRRDTSNYQLTVEAASGELKRVDSSPLNYLVANSNKTNSLLLSGSLNEINLALTAAATYHAPSSVYANDNLTIQLADTEGVVLSNGWALIEIQSSASLLVLDNHGASGLLFGSEDTMMEIPPVAIKYGGDEDRQALLLSISTQHGTIDLGEDQASLRKAYLELGSSRIYQIEGLTHDLNKVLSALNYLPDQDFNYFVSGSSMGPGVLEVVNITLTDSTGSLATQIFDIWVGPVNDPPQLQGPASLAVTTGLSQLIAPVISVTDPDSLDVGIGILDLNVSAAHGSVYVDTLGPMLSAAPTCTMGGNLSTLSFHGMIDVVNQILSSLQYRPPSGFLGNDVIHVRVSDNGWHGSGPVGVAALNIPVTVSLPSATSSIAMSATDFVLSVLEDNFLLLPAAVLPDGLEDSAATIEASVSAAYGRVGFDPGSDFQRMKRVDYIIEASGTADNDVEQIVKLRTKVDWTYEIQQLQIATNGNESQPTIAVSLDYGHRTSITSVTLGASDDTDETSLQTALQALPNVGFLEVVQQADAIERGAVVRRFDIIFLSNPGDVPLLTIDGPGTSLNGALWAKIVLIQQGDSDLEIQRVTLTSSTAVHNGTFQLICHVTEPSSGPSQTVHMDDSFTSAEIAFNATSNQLQQAVEWINGVGLVSVTKTALTNGWAWDVTFRTRFGPVPLMTAIWSTGSSDSTERGSYPRYCEACTPFVSNTTILGVNRVQAATVPISGSFALKHQPYGSDKVSRSMLIPVMASAEFMRSRLESMGTVGRNTTRVTRVTPSATPEDELEWWITFYGNSRGRLDVDTTDILGTGAHVYISTENAGASSLAGSFRLDLSLVGSQTLSTRWLAFDSTAGEVTDALIATEAFSVRDISVSRQVQDRGPLGSLYRWTVSFLRDIWGGAEGENVLPNLTVGASNLTGSGANVVTRMQSRADDSNASSTLIVIGATAPPKTSEVQSILCSTHGLKTNVSFSFRGVSTGPIGIHTVLSPRDLPPCKVQGPKPCAGDGSSLEERLSALRTVGRVLIRSVRPGNGTICPLKGGPPTEAEITFLDDQVAPGDLPLLTVSTVGSAKNFTGIRVREVVKGSAPRVSEIQLISLRWMGHPPFVAWDRLGDISLRLSLQGAWSDRIPFDASAEIMKDVLQGMASVGSVDVFREEDRNGLGVTWSVTFTGNSSPSNDGDVDLLIPQLSCGTTQAPAACSGVGWNTSASVSEVVRGSAAVWGRYRMRLNLPSEDSTISYVTPSLLHDATARDVLAAVTSVVPLGMVVNVTRYGNPAADAGFIWALDMNPKPMIVLESDPAQPLTGPTIYCARIQDDYKPCEFPFYHHGKAHFGCADSGKGQPGWCSIETNTSVDSFGTCIPCKVSLPPPTLKVHQLHSAIKLRGTLSASRKLLSTLTYLPSPDWNTLEGGYDRVTVTTTNLLRSAAADSAVTWYVDVKAVNDPPAVRGVSAVPLAVQEDQTLPVEGISITDPDLLGAFADRPIEVALTVSHGRLSLASLSGLNVIRPSTDLQSIITVGVPMMTIQGSLENINDALASMVYSPNPLDRPQTPWGPEIQRISMTPAVTTNPVMLLRTSVLAGGIHGNFSLRINCSSMLDSDEYRWISLRHSFFNGSISLQANASAATGPLSVHAAFTDLFQGCSNILRNSTHHRNFTDPFAQVAVHVSRGDADTTRGLTWEILLLGVGEERPLISVRRNNLRNQGGHHKIHGTKPTIEVVYVNEPVMYPSLPVNTFWLRFEGYQSRPLHLNASALDVQVALEEIPVLGDIAVSRTNDGLHTCSWLVTFNSLGGGPDNSLPLLTCTSEVLDPAGGRVFMEVVRVNSANLFQDVISIAVSDLGEFGEGQAQQAYCNLSVTILPVHAQPSFILSDQVRMMGGLISTSEDVSVFLNEVISIQYPPSISSESYELKLHSPDCIFTMSHPPVAKDSYIVRNASTASMSITGEISQLEAAIAESAMVTPDRDFYGVTTLTFTLQALRSNAGTIVSTVQLVVYSVDDPVEIQAPSSILVVYGEETRIQGLQILDADAMGPQSENLPVRLFLSCQHGEISVGSSPLFSMLALPGYNNTLSLECDAECLNQALTALSYRCSNVHCIEDVMTLSALSPGG